MPNPHDAPPGTPRNPLAAIKGRGAVSQLQHRFASSPTIRVNGRDIQLEGKESKCDSCGDLCGDDVDCRIWLYQGKEYTSPPPAMIIDAILREVYGQPAAAVAASEPFVLPDNLRKFFRAMREKK